MDEINIRDNIINIGDMFGFIEITSQPFRDESKNGRTYIYYYCKCNNCGKENIKIRRSNLLNENIKSCGCISMGNRKYNKYDMGHYYGICYFNNPSHGYFIFDKEDYDIIKDFCWCKSASGYAVTRDKNTNKIIYLHKLIISIRYPSLLNENLVVDHIDCDKLNDMKINLRICSQLENTYNHKLSINNTTGTTGIRKVTLNNNKIKYVARIFVNGKQIDLGHFDNEEDAINARICAEQKYFGEYAYQEMKRPINPFRYV